jgi:Na+/proline symporter
MSGYSTGEPPSQASSASSLSVPFLVLAAVLIGVGLFGMAYWLVTFQWVYFASLIPLALGGYMLFTRGTGPDRA